jgi:hypothetical protein
MHGRRVARALARRAPTFAYRFNATYPFPMGTLKFLRAAYRPPCTPPRTAACRL